MTIIVVDLWMPLLILSVGVLVWLRLRDLGWTTRRGDQDETAMSFEERARRSGGADGTRRGYRISYRNLMTSHEQLNVCYETITISAPPLCCHFLLDRESVFVGTRNLFTDYGSRLPEFPDLYVRTDEGERFSLLAREPSFSALLKRLEAGEDFQYLLAADASDRNARRFSLKSEAASDGSSTLTIARHGHKPRERTPEGLAVQLDQLTDLCVLLARPTGEGLPRARPSSRLTAFVKSPASFGLFLLVLIALLIGAIVLVVK